MRRILTLLVALLGVAPSLAADPEMRQFDRILVEGNHRFDDRDVRATAGLEAGQPLRRDDLLRAVAALDGTGEFRDVTIAPRGADLVITVREEPAHSGRLNFGIGYDSVSGPVGQADLFLGGLAGGAVELEASASISKNARNAVFDITRKDVFRNGLDAGFRLSYQDLKYSDAVFSHTRIAATPYLRLTPRPGAEIELRYSRVSERISAMRADASPVLRADAGRHDAHIIGMSAALRSVDPGRLAWRIGLDQEFLREDRGGRALSRSAVEAEARLALGRGFALRSTVEAAALRGSGGSAPLVTDRFLLGGAGLRGFAPGGVTPRDVTATGKWALGADSYAVLRSDFIIPILPKYERIESFAFYDIGKIWGMSAAAAPGGALVGLGETRHSYGLGLTARTEVGRLEAWFGLGRRGAAGDEKQGFGLTFRSDF